MNMPGTSTSESWAEGLRATAISDVGTRRANNQDAYVQLPAEDAAMWRARGHLFAVADGMGAHAAGELASRMAVESIAHHYRQHLDLSPTEAILKAVQDANREIYQRGQANTDFHNMGTTCSVLLLLPAGAMVAHVGDSRVYRLRGQQLEQLTFDHSLVWEARAAAGGSKNAAAIQLPKNVITRSLGPHPHVQVDLEGPFPVEPGDRFLLCSDGLMARLEDQEIATILANMPRDEAAEVLVDLANCRGGPDNITVLVIDVEHPLGEDGPSEPGTAGKESAVPAGVTPWILGTLICALVAVGLVIAGEQFAAAFFFALAIVSAMPALWQILSPRGVHGPADLHAVGKGPYTRCRVEKGSGDLFRLIDSVRGALDDSVATDADSLDETSRCRASNCLDEALACAKAGRAREAMRAFALSLRILQNRQTLG